MPCHVMMVATMTSMTSLRKFRCSNERGSKSDVYHVAFVAQSSTGKANSETHKKAKKMNKSKQICMIFASVFAISNAYAASKDSAFDVYIEAEYPSDADHSSTILTSDTDSCARHTRRS